MISHVVASIAGCAPSHHRSPAPSGVGGKTNHPTEDGGIRKRSRRPVLSWVTVAIQISHVGLDNQTLPRSSTIVTTIQRLRPRAPPNEARLTGRMVDRGVARSHLQHIAMRKENVVSRPQTSRRVILGVIASALGSLEAAAHHGWSWAEGEQTELRGTVREIYVGQPHPNLRVETTEGVWLIELANPGQTERAGFVASSAAPGDPVIAIGNRSRTAGERRMKAVKITVRGRSYDIYPERVQGG